ncbi:MAG: TadE/TadG family type IV pilus assembly protein [Aureliella sp.]
MAIERQFRKSLGCRKSSRQGSALILTVFTSFMLFCFLAFSIDTGFLAGARAEMRRSADAASLAGCWELYRQMQNGELSSGAQTAARQISAEYVTANRVVNSSMSVDTGAQSQDIAVGYLASLASTDAVSQNSDLPFMAVQVSLKKTAERNGQVPFFFGKIFGNSGQNMQTSSTAVMAQRISGFALPPNSTESLKILPFALDLDTWTALKAGGGTDGYHYDAASGKVYSGGDGIREVNLYPQGTGSPGNRGTVDIGDRNNSTADIARQITNGISRDDLVALGKPLALDAEGKLELNGDTGISAGVKDELASVIGQTRVIPVFASVCGNGNNATYRIVKWVGVRIMDVKLTGALSGKKLVVEPAPIISQYVTVGGTFGSSDGIFSPVVLTR